MIVMNPEKGRKYYICPDGKRPEMVTFLRKTPAWYIYKDSSGNEIWKRFIVFYDSLENCGWTEKLVDEVIKKTPLPKVAVIKGSALVFE